MKKAVNLSCADRVKQYPKGSLHADDGQLFCTSCNVTLDHTRKGSIDRHFQTPGHAEKRRLQDESEQRSVKKQATISGSFKRVTEARDARNVAHFELVEALTAANIPLYKLDHPRLRDYLQKNITNLGALPTSHQLRAHYLPKVHDVLQQELKEKVASASSVVIVTDEASDSQDRFVLHVLFILPVADVDQAQMEVLTVDLIYLEHVNGTTVSQAIMQTLSKYDVDFNKVSAFITDNASYMSKTFGIVKGLLPNCVHVTCNAHIMNLVGETWRKHFPKVDRLVACFKTTFLHCASRKRRYVDYLADQTQQETIAIPPTPVVTRWNSWFRTVSHHTKYVHHYRGFIAKELELSTATNALTELSTLLESDQIIDEVRFVADSSVPLVELLTWFENRHVTIHLAYNKIMDLLATFSAKSEDAGLPQWQRETYSDASAKLIQYYCSDTDGRQTARFVQPGLAFMQAVRLFDPQQAKTLTFSDFSANIPGADCRYMLEETAAYKQAVRETDSDVQPLTYWFANKERFPHLFDLAIRYLSVPTNSVDAERSVSQYTSVNAPQRQSFSDRNLALQVMAAFNARD